MAKQVEKKKLNRTLGGNLTIFSLLSIVGLFMILPIFYTVVTAFKPMDEIFIFPPKFMVINPTLDNFTQLFAIVTNLWVPFTRYAFNSIFVTVAATAGHVILASMAAYPLAKHKFPGSRFIFSVIVLSLLFSSQITFLPQYVVMAKIGLIDSYGALILPALQSSLGLFLMKQFMSQVPDPLLEAAKIDGASEFRIFWQIVMPSVKPAWLTLSIFAFQAVWNQSGQTLKSLVYSEVLKPLPVLLSGFSDGGIAFSGIGAAAGLIILIPPLVLFIFCQSFVMETMTTSGIK